jgi:AcrR family transcriptional regulator
VVASVKGTKGMARVERERRLIESAERAISTVGYDAASLDEIAREAGVTRPMIYAYFGSKEGLFVAGIHRAYERFLEEVEAAAFFEGSAKERTERLIHAVFGWAEDYLGLWPYLRGAEAIGGVIASEVAADQAGMVALIARFMSDVAGDESLATDLEPIAEICVAINGAIIDRWARHRDEPRELHEARAMWSNWSLLGPLVGDMPPSTG